jgi:hypothetical protein
LLETREFLVSHFAAAIGTDEALIGRQIGPYRRSSP